MKLHPTTTKQYQTVTGYDAGGVEINAQHHAKSLLVMPESAPRDWDVASFEQLTDHAEYARELNQLAARLVQIKLWVIFCVWPATCFATAVTLHDSLRGVPGLAWAAVLIMSTVSGLTALLNRLRDIAPPRPKLYMASYMLGSVVAGVVMFFICESGDVNDFAEAVAIGVAAYAGAALMDKLAQRAVV